MEKVKTLMALALMNNKIKSFHRRVRRGTQSKSRSKSLSSCLNFDSPLRPLRPEGDCVARETTLGCCGKSIFRKLKMLFIEETSQTEPG